MGLPIWRAPSPKAKDAQKADVSAAARSPIRRRRPIPNASQRSPDFDFASDMLLRINRLNNAQTTARSLNAPQRLPPPPVPESPDYMRRTPPGEQGMVSSRGIWLYENEEELADARYRNAEVGTRPSIARNSFPSQGRALPALTPNFAPAAASLLARQSSSHGRFRSRSSRHDRQAHRNTPPPRVPVDFARYRDNTRAAHGNGNSSAGSQQHGDEEGRDNIAVGFPLLRRMGRRDLVDGPLPMSSLRESWSPTSAVDGLGDRERSLSPVEDNWEPMLSTVAPDPLPPTADSSFASAAASASFSQGLSHTHPRPQSDSRTGSSNSNSAASSRTHLTVPSQDESFANPRPAHLCDTSDSDNDASDTEEEDEDFFAGHFGQPRSVPYEGVWQGLPTQHAPWRLLPHPSPMVREALDDQPTSTRSFYGEVVAQPVARLQHEDLDAVTVADEQDFSEEDMTLDQELRDARTLIERLTRRDDISDDFWASVGLRRPLADRVERIQQRDGL